MIFKLKTSKNTQEIFEEIGRSTSLKPYTLVKHAIAWSLQTNTPITEFNSDNTRRLNLEETKEKIASLEYIQNELNGIENLAK